MSAIQNWQTKKLGEICAISIGKTPARGNARFWDEKKETNNVWLSIRDMNHTDGKEIFDSSEYISDAGASLFKNVPKGTLLVSFKLTLGRLAFAGIDLRTNEAIAALKIKNEQELLKEYLYYYLTFFDWVEATKGDTKVKGKTLNKAKLKEIQVFFPPISEQRRLVALMDELSEKLEKAKENAEKNLESAKNLFDSYLESIFTNTNDGWRKMTLKDVSMDFGRGKSKHRPRNDKKLYGGNYPFIQTGDVRNAQHFITDFTQTYNETGLSQSKLWPKGTVCITIAANIAETGILDFNACFPDSIIGLVPNSKITTSDFVEYLLTFYSKSLKAKGKGSAQDNINMGTFENEHFLFPSLDEQKRILKKLDELYENTKKLEVIYSKKLAQLDDLKKSILDQAFAGKLS